MNRRELLIALAAGAVVTAEGLWFPGTKLISIPKPVLHYDFTKDGLNGHILDLKYYRYSQGRYYDKNDILRFTLPPA